MRRFLVTWTPILLAGALVLTLAPPTAARKGKHPTDLAQILSQMNEVGKHLKTVSANLEYTKYTKLVDDKSTESGQLYFRRGKTTEIRIDFVKPDRKTLLVKKNKGEFYLPRINEIQEYNLEQKSDLVQQFFLLGFGTDSGELKKAYDVKYLREEDIEDDTTVLLELTPHRADMAAQFTKIHLWVSEDSWLPSQQQFFQPGGDYFVARYTGMKVNRVLPGSIFELNAPANAKRHPMN